MEVNLTETETGPEFLAWQNTQSSIAAFGVAEGKTDLSRRSGVNFNDSQETANRAAKDLLLFRVIVRCSHFGLCIF